MPPPRAAYPLSWRVLDAVEAVVARLRPAPALRPWALLLPALALVGLLVAGLGFIADLSLRTLDRDTFRMSADWSLDNYARAFGDALYLRIAWRSLFAALVVTAITLLFAFPYAYVMIRTRRAWLRKALLVALFLPFFIGQVVRAYGWLILLGSQGAANAALGLLGFEPVRLLYNYPAVLFGLAQYMLPFAVLMLAPALTAIPEEVEAAAASLGANWRRSFLHVVLPMARPGLVGAGLVVMTLTLTDFAMPAILGGGSQDFIANAIYDQFFRTSDQGLGAALAMALTGLGSLAALGVVALFGAGSLVSGGGRR